jgi:hypothetical protein
MNLFPSSLLPNLRRNRRIWLIIPMAPLMAATLMVEAAAQSGRRTPSPPTSSPSPLPLDSAAAPKAETAKPTANNPRGLRVRLLFARQLTSKHLLNEDVIAASFFKRLTDFINVDCTSIGDLKQAQALARAKSEREAFVVLLKFDINSYQSGTILLNSPDLEIEYLAFAPRTGKKHVKGKIYFQTIGGGRMQRSGWPNGTPIRITPEGAGIEAAETLHHLLLAKAAATPPQHP